MTTGQRVSFSLSSNGAYFWAGMTAVSWGLLWLFRNTPDMQSNLNGFLVDAYYVVGTAISLLLTLKLLLTPVIRFKLSVGGVGGEGDEAISVIHGLWRTRKHKWIQHRDASSRSTARVFGGDISVTCRTEWGEMVTVYLGPNRQKFRSVIRSLRGAAANGPKAT